jgi:hypothetical protein
MEEIGKLRHMNARKGARGLSEGRSSKTFAHSHQDDLARMEQQRQQKLLRELDMLKRKVVHMRDAEARAKVPFLSLSLSLSMSMSMSVPCKVTASPSTLARV